MPADKNPPILLTGNVYCSWNAFSWLNPVPDRMQPGDLVVWSWSGKSNTPSSSQNEGLFAVSVSDGKKRRQFRVKNTRIHRLLPFKNQGERETNLRAIIRELLTLKGQTLTWNDGAYRVSFSDVA
jgi:hypothetical protein